MSTLRIAMPKGRLMESALAEFERAGISEKAPDIGRKLVIPLKNGSGSKLELLLVKNADVPTYVEHGVAEFGVCGTDVLDEADCDVMRPWTFAFGRCRIAIAGRPEVDMSRWSAGDTLLVASKYPRITRRHFSDRGWNAEVIKLNGSVELAAVLGLSDVIVDLVESGRTLKENGLVVHEVLGETRVKLIATRGLTRAQNDVLAWMVDELSAADRDKS